ncbi:MAG: hypothetical protein IVW51_14720 [Thermaceae bacterium]|nr:hypothetical protein [Thermaceae bacterium]
MKLRLKGMGLVFWGLLVVSLAYIVFLTTAPRAESGQTAQPSATTSAVQSDLASAPKTVVSTQPTTVGDTPAKPSSSAAGSDSKLQGVTLVSSSSAAPVGQNLISNPRFESGTSAWKLYGKIFAVVSPGHPGHARAVKVMNAWVEQPLPVSSVEAGATYALEGWGRSLSGAVCKLGFLGGKGGGVLLFNNRINFTGSAWEHKSLTQILPTDTIWAVVYLQDSGKECQFDDLSLMVRNAVATH